MCIRDRSTCHCSVTEETVVVLAERLVGADSCSHHRLRSARTCPESAKNSPPGSDSRSPRPHLAGKDVPRPLGVDGLSSQYSNVNWQASLLGSDRDMPGRRSAVCLLYTSPSPRD